MVDDWLLYHNHLRLRWLHCENQSDYPPYQAPTKKQIDHDHHARIGAMAHQGDYRRKKVKDAQESEHDPYHDDRRRIQVVCVMHVIPPPCALAEGQDSQCAIE